jgi:hypothetical protein
MESTKLKPKHEENCEGELSNREKGKKTNMKGLGDQ